MNLKHWLFLALLAALIAGPTVNAQKQKGRTSRRTAITGAAAESWKTFLPAFTAAVKNNDRAYLRKVMVKDFTYTFGDSADDQDQAFRFFDDRPVSAASIAQVHTALLQSGREVIVKVRRPAIEDQIELDLAVMRRTAELLERLAGK